MSLHIARRKKDASDRLSRFDQDVPGAPFLDWFSSNTPINTTRGAWYPTRPFAPEYRAECIEAATAICDKLRELKGDDKLGGWQIVVVDDGDTIVWDSILEYGSQGVVFLPLRPRRR